MIDTHAFKATAMENKEQPIGHETYPEPAYNPPGFRFAELRNQISDMLAESRNKSAEEMKAIYLELNIKCIRMARVCKELW